MKAHPVSYVVEIRYATSEDVRLHGPRFHQDQDISRLAVDASASMVRRHLVTLLCLEFRRSSKYGSVIRIVCDARRPQLPRSDKVGNYGIARGSQRPSQFRPVGIFVTPHSVHLEAPKRMTLAFLTFVRNQHSGSFESQITNFTALFTRTHAS